MAFLNQLLTVSYVNEHGVMRHIYTGTFYNPTTIVGSTTIPSLTLTQNSLRVAFPISFVEPPLVTVYPSGTFSGFIIEGMDPEMLTLLVGETHIRVDGTRVLFDLQGETFTHVSGANTLSDTVTIGDTPSFAADTVLIRAEEAGAATDLPAIIDGDQDSGHGLLLVVAQSDNRFELFDGQIRLKAGEMLATGESAQVTLRVTDFWGNTSDQLVTIQANAAPEGELGILGAARGGEVLHADLSGLSDAEGIVSVSYQWLRDGQVIADATSDSYRLKAADIGKSLSLTVTYVDGAGYEESVSQTVAGLIAPVNQTLRGNAGGDGLTGGIGADSISGFGGDDVLRGGAGDDWIWGGHGNDLIEGGFGADSLLGGIGNDTIFGGNGNDTLNGGPGDDRLNGGAGDDLILSGSGVNVIAGHDGDDHILLQVRLGGINRISGGEGADVFQFNYHRAVAGSTSVITDFENTDIIKIGEIEIQHSNPDDMSLYTQKGIYFRETEGGDMAIHFGREGTSHFVILDGVSQEAFWSGT